MKYTLLEIVQEILSDMDSDEVNSISDTTESLQVAGIVKETYYHLVSQNDLPEHTGLFQLDASGDNTKPVLMTMPSNALKLYWIKYDKQTNAPGSDAEESVYDYVNFLDLDVFLERSQQLSTKMLSLELVDGIPTEVWGANPYVDSMTVDIDGTNFEFKFYNNQAPTYFTVIGDETIIFDSYNSNVDTTLQQSKTYCYGLLEPTFTLSDSYTPDIDATEFNWFVNEAKKAAFAKLKQVRDPIADERAKRGWVRSQRNREKTPANVPFYSRFNSYGRNR